jgi:SecD/SecF fusion protein
VLIGQSEMDYARDLSMAAPIWEVVNDAIARPADLKRVTNFNPQVARSMVRDATIAIVLSMFFITAYVWLRFGNLKYGTATIIALLHDALMTVGLIGLSHYIAGTLLGNALMIEPFRMNLTLVAAILTVMGYSVNDTIVVFDRIRENRGKFGHINRKVINDSINQTFSRTILTGGTTLVVLLVMYIWGGPSIHGFTFAMLGGVLVGTYSSIAIAAPILLLGGKDLVPGPEPRPLPGNRQQLPRTA